jgi:flagellar biosynthesis/type III secretory pathway ATPase
MVNENYSNKKIIAISGAGPSAVTRFSTPYLCKDLAKYFKKQHSAPLKYPQFVTA